MYNKDYISNITSYLSYEDFFNIYLYIYKTNMYVSVCVCLSVQ